MKKIKLGDKVKIFKKVIKLDIFWDYNPAFSNKAELNGYCIKSLNDTCSAGSCILKECPFVNSENFSEDIIGIIKVQKVDTKDFLNNGIIVGIRKIAYKRHIEFTETEDKHIHSNVKGHDFKTVYLVAVNLKQIVKVFLEDLELLEEEK